MYEKEEKKMISINYNSVDYSKQFLLSSGLSV